jgi:hypothetical protein
LNYVRVWNCRLVMSLAHGPAGKASYATARSVILFPLCPSVSSVVIAVQAKPFTAEDAEVTEEDG